MRRGGSAARLYTRNAYDQTVRLPAIAAAAQRIKAKSFTIDGEAVVLGPDGLSKFEELRRRMAAHAAVRSGPCAAWIKVRNPASVAVQRERSDEKWNR